VLLAAIAAVVAQHAFDVPAAYSSSNDIAGALLIDKLRCGSDYLCQETFYVLLPALMAVVAVGFGPCKTQVGGGLKI
jgi:hypothetical protein